MSGCQKETESSAPVEPAPVIDQSNAKSFLKKLAADYLTLANSLQAKADFYKKNNDIHGFLTYRNREWTPNYTARKLFYEKTLQQNKSYLSQQKLEKPFDVFSSLIYIGLDIKHGLQNSDQQKLESTYKQLANDISYMQKIKAL